LFSFAALPKQALAVAIMQTLARSALECGGLAPPWNNASDESQGGVRPPHSKGAT